MKLVKTGFAPFVSDDATVIEAYKQNGWTEAKEEPKEVKATPKKVKKD